MKFINTVFFRNYLLKLYLNNWSPIVTLTFHPNHYIVETFPFIIGIPTTSLFYKYEILCFLQSVFKDQKFQTIYSGQKRILSSSLNLTFSVNRDCEFKFFLSNCLCAL